jgi:excisionase family DNA binding protein
MQLQEPTPLLSVTEFAARLRVTPACVRRWLFESKIAKIKLGRVVRIPASEADRLISEGLCPARIANRMPVALESLMEAALSRRQPSRNSSKHDSHSATKRKAQ